MSIQDYLERIKYYGPITTTISCLKELHRCHVISIPFEALDIHLGRSIVLDLECIFEKVISHRRGGYCYELNYLFNWMLQELGFRSNLISARIYDGGQLGPDYDHMAILVELDGSWLVDVGYGDLFIEPLELNLNSITQDQCKDYRIIKKSDCSFELQESFHNRNDFLSRYLFELRSCPISAFEEQNKYKQSNPDSYFVKNLICTLPDANHRYTIFNKTYKIRSGNNQESVTTELNSPEQLKQILYSRFHIKLSDDETSLLFYS